MSNIEHIRLSGVDHGESQHHGYTSVLSKLKERVI